MSGIRLDILGGMNLVTSPDLLKEGFPYLENVRRNLQGRTIARPPLGDAIDSTSGADGITSLTRMNDTTALGPVSGYVLIIGNTGSLYVNSTAVASSLSGNPLSFLPYRPPSSPQPWCYIADSSMTVNVPAYSYPLAGMLKVRSDGTVWKTGVKEPQAAPSVVVSGGGGPNWVSYRYRYRDDRTGARSNPSPESAPQTVAQSSVAGSFNGSDYATKLTYNASQYEYVSVFRTKGGVSPGTVTDYVVAHNFGLTLPANIRVDGVQIALNWAGQYAGTGVLSGVALFYQGNQIGQAKGPGVLNAQYVGSSGTTVTQGGNSDSWGTVLDDAIVNDSTFGFGVQITTLESGGSDRSFLYSFTITVYYTVLTATLTCTPSDDPQVNVIDIFRQDPGLDDFTFVGTVPNATPSFIDTLTDLEVIGNPLLERDNFEPFPSIDLPRSGTLNIIDSTGGAQWVSGDQFNTRWLPNNIVLIADSTGGSIPWLLYNRPTSLTAMKVYSTTKSSTGYLTIGYPSVGSSLAWEISEPELAAQASPVIWGPTPDNAGSFYFGLDPNNPGDLLWSKGNNFDSAPDTNRMYICSPSETLMNGTVTSELSTVFSTERFWLLYNNSSDAVATVTGTAGQQWIPIQAAATRGLYMRYALCALGSAIAWRAKDGIYLSQGGGPEQEISNNIYNLFPHGQPEAPSPVVLGGITVYPPDDTKLNKQTMAFVPGYIFYDYQDVNGNPRHLVFDIQAKGWVVDTYTPEVNCHASAVGVQQVLVGCVDGSARIFDNNGTEAGNAIILTRSEAGGSTRVVKRIGGVFLRALASSAITLAFWANRIQTAITGFLPAVTGTNAEETDYLTDLTSATNADVKDLACQFTWPIVSGNILSEWEPDWTDLPQQIIGIKTGLLSYGKGWANMAWINLAYSSTADVKLVATLASNANETGSTIVLIFPATGGVQAKQFLTFPPNKFKIVGWTANSSEPFTIFAEDSELEVTVWGEGAKLVRPFSGKTMGIPQATT